MRRFDYSVYKQKLDIDSPNFYDHTKKDLLFEILLEYKDYNDKMYLNYISFHNQFKLIRPPKFYIKDVFLNPSKREMKLFLNKPTANWPNDFSVKYQGKNIKADYILKVDSTALVIKFSNDYGKHESLIDLLFSEIKDEKKRSLDIKIRGLVDEQGNGLGERKSEIMNQFREFFTQKVFPEAPKYKNDSRLIKKPFPLGFPLQPKHDQDLNADYWMNTPLKSVQ